MMERASDILLAELNHRVANSFQIVGALLSLEAKRQPESADAFQRASAQLGAFALVHRLLEPAQEGLGTVEVSTYLKALCTQLYRGCLEPHGIALDVSVAQGMAFPKFCQHLGVIVTELVCNAAKHAFAGRDSGAVRVIVGRNRGCWSLAVIDDGRGFDFHDVANAHGLGLVQRLVHAIDGELSCQSSPLGTKIALCFPDPIAR